MTMWDRGNTIGLAGWARLRVRMETRRETWHQFAELPRSTTQEKLRTPRLPRASALTLWNSSSGTSECHHPEWEDLLPDDAIMVVDAFAGVPIAEIVGAPNLLSSSSLLSSVKKFEATCIIRSVSGALPPHHNHRPNFTFLLGLVVFWLCCLTCWQS